MKTWVVITDLTRMQGTRVCLAGYTADKTCIRPVFTKPKGLTEEWLQATGQGIIRPFAVVEFDLVQPIPEPPHTEDWIISPVYRVKRILDPEGQRALLETIVDNSIASIIGIPIQEEHQTFYVVAGEGTRSLGTIRPREITSVVCQGGLPDKRRYRIAFTDAEGESYQLAVTDLAFRYYMDDLTSTKRLSPQKASAQMKTLLNEAAVFLRIGLARHWEKHPDRCYLQITGVHTFPDYLEGRCYADFPQAHHLDLSEGEPRPF